MSVDGNVSVKCDHCGKQREAEAVRADGSRWMRVVPYAMNPIQGIGRQSAAKKDFCGNGCLSAFCAANIPPNKGE